MCVCVVYINIYKQPPQNKIVHTTLTIIHK